MAEPADPAPRVENRESGAKDLTTRSSPVPTDPSKLASCCRARRAARMPSPADRASKGSPARLALWVAGGGKVAPWCRENGVALRTAYRWSRRPDFVAKVDAHRRRASDRAVGLLAKHAVTAVAGMAELAKSAESESTKLSAQRGILAELRDMTGFAALERRMADVEAKLKDKPAEGRP